MKKWWKHSKRNVIRGVFAVSCALLFFMSQKCVSFAEAAGKVIPRSVKVRQSPDGNSEVIGSSSSGTTVTIISQATDASGYVWYEVYVDANKTGYIRSDMIDVDSSSGSIPTSSSAEQTDTSAPSAGTAPGAEVMPETGMENQYATIKARSAKIRSGASTSKSVVDSLAEGTQVIVSGQTEGTDKPWYYITFTGTNGVEKTGYVRSDLVTLGDMVPVEEQQPEEQPEEQQPEEQDTTQTERNDYEVVNEGGEWWLYDWTDRENGTKQRLEEVLLAAHAQTMNDEVDMETLSRQRIVIIVLIGVIIALVVALTIMIFKLRDAYYESYEDDEDEEEDEEEEEDNRRKSSRRRDDKDRDERESRRESRNRESKGREDRESRSREGKTREDREERVSRSRDERVRESRRREDTDREEPVKRKSTARDDRQTAPRKRTTDSDKRMPAKEVTYEDDGVTPVKTAPKKKAKNFLVDDDDFEFEFLNMKNKDNDI